MMTMRVLKRIISAVRDESGAALFVTVAVFMFMYLAILGVYAIGMNVRTRIHLQNACDAAAYSAAVVQADALSRIATLNRAMSWTYCQMTKRQMDYIVHKWLRHTVSHYEEDRAAAIKSGSGGHHGHKDNWIGVNHLNPSTENCVRLRSPNGNRRHDIRQVQSACNGFRAHLGNGRESFYVPGGAYVDVLTRLGLQLDRDKANIQGLNAAIDNIMNGLPQRIYAAANSVALANLPQSTIGERIYVKHSNPSEYMRMMNGVEEVSFRNFSGDRASDFIPRAWLPLFSNRENGRNVGFCRNYGRGLVSEWEWWSKRWLCPPRSKCIPVYTGTCPHDCQKGDRCRGWPIHSSRLEAGALRDRHYDGQLARPQVLTRDYFGSNGTITVGIAVDNRNPFERILGRVSGLFSAFNPGVDKTLCLSSAKAGYCRTLGGDNNACRYSIDWNNGFNQSCNLCQSDWDAVFVPVRRSWSSAVNGVWQDDGASFLRGLVAWLGIVDADFRAGRSVSSSQSKYVKYLQDDKDGVGGGPVGWRVGNPGGTVDWDRLHDRMFH